MDTFIKARERHQVVKAAAATDAAVAAEIWGAITEQGDPMPGSFAEAVRDTLPIEHAAILSTQAVAAASAFAALWQAPRYGRSAFERREHAREGWDAFGAVAKRAEDMIEGFGWDLSTSWEHARATDAKAPPEMVARVARLAGRMYATLRGASAQRVAGMAGEVHSVELGGAVERLLPSMYAAIMDEHLEIPALYDVSRRRAPQYAVRGTDKRARGPIVLMLDESGSMHGSRNEWAKAAAIAVARVAAAEKRRVAIVHFGTSVVVRDLVASDPASVLEMIGHFLSGGTDVGLALTSAIAEVKRLAARGDQGADVITATDGIDPASVEVQRAAVETMRAQGVRLWTVAIECVIAADAPLRAGATSYSELGREALGEGESVKMLAGATR